MEWENEVEEIIARKGRNDTLTPEKDWVKKAIEQRSPNLTVGVAYSEPLVYDQIDQKLFANKYNNEKN